MNEFRRDPIAGHLVIVSSARDARPNQFAVPAALPGENREEVECQFCASSMDTPPVVVSYDKSGNALDNKLIADWQVCVVPNLYPSLDSRVSLRQETRTEKPYFRGTKGDYPAPAFGYHEVVIESPTHVTRTSDLTDQQFKAMVFAYRDRVRDLQLQEGIDYVQVIKNSGKDAGASIRHTHSQIFGLPLIPSQVRQEIENAAQLFAKERRCAFCQLIEHELEFADRIVMTTDEFVAWCPYASRVSYEVHVAPRSHRARFDEESDLQLGDFAKFLQQVIQRLELHPRIHAYNYLLHSLPVGREEQPSYHWHFEILPRIAKQAGFEWGTGIYINTVAPEYAARELRDTIA